jgi:hypothetical protein
VEVDLDGSAEITLGPSDPETRLFSLLNLLLAGLAFVGPSSGVVVLHASGVVLDGRAFVMPGAAGAGKSTFTALCAASGASVLSEDVILLDTSGDHPEALASPFREDRERPASPGRATVACVLFPEHGTPPAVLEVPRMVARAKLVANLPFVNERFGHDPALDGIVERLAGSTLARTLRFAPDPGFVPLLRDLAAGPAGS